MNNLNANNKALGGLAPKANLKAPAPNAAPKVAPKDVDKGPNPKSLANARLGEGWEKYASTKAEGKQFDLSGLKKGGAADQQRPQGPEGAPGKAGGGLKGALQGLKDQAQDKAALKTLGDGKTAPKAPMAEKAPAPENRATTTAARPQQAPERPAAPRPGAEPQAGVQREPAGLRSLTNPPTAQAQAPPPASPQAPAAPAPTPQAAPAPQQAPPPPLPQAPANLPAAQAALPREAAAPQQSQQQQARPGMPTVAPPPPDAAGRQSQQQPVRNNAPMGYLPRQEMARQQLMQQNRTTPPPPGQAAAKGGPGAPGQAANVKGQPAATAEKPGAALGKQGQAPGAQGQEANNMLAARARQQQLMQGLQPKAESAKPGGAEAAQAAAKAKESPGGAREAASGTAAGVAKQDAKESSHPGTPLALHGEKGEARQSEAATRAGGAAKLQKTLALEEEGGVDDRKVEEKDPGRRCPQCSTELPGEQCGACPVCRMGAPDVLYLAAVHYLRKGDWLSTTADAVSATDVAREALPTAAPVLTLHYIPAIPSAKDVLHLKTAG